MDDFERLSKIFDMKPFDAKREIPKAAPLAKIEETSDDKKESDFDLTRNTIRDLINTNNDAIKEMISIAKSSEKGRDFEVAGQLMKTQSETAKDLLDIHKQLKDIEDDKTNIKTQNNILFTGSTSDLIKQIEEKRKEVIDVKSKE
tara:strand:+ start:906 stop:1340 length:435 start_codon:yes stop_codon:yes gene_type:complete